MSKQRSSSQPTSGRSTSSPSSTTRPTQGTAGGATRATITEQITMETAVGTGASSAGQARPVTEQARAVTEQAKDLAGTVQEKATQKVESGIAKGKSQVAESLHALNQSLLISGQQLRDRNQQNVSRYVDNLANRVQRAADYLQNTEVSEIIDRTEDFARRQPALILGGAFVLGLLGARFLKSSRRQTVESGEWRAGGGATGARGYRRAGTAAIGYDATIPPIHDEYSATRVEVLSPPLADVTPAGIPMHPLGESGFARQRDPLDYGAARGGPDSSRR
jgi:hypothetical protein